MRRIKVFEIEFEDYSDVDNKDTLVGTMFAKYVKLGELWEKMSKDFKFNEENNTELLKEVMRENVELLCVMERITELEK